MSTNADFGWASLSEIFQMWTLCKFHTTCSCMWHCITVCYVGGCRCPCGSGLFLWTHLEHSSKFLKYYVGALVV